MMRDSHLAIKLAAAIVVYAPTVWLVMRMQRGRWSAAGAA